jgi:hypothetical protein
MAAQVFKCGVDNSVSGMANMIATGNTEGNNAAESSQMFHGNMQGYCLTNHTCAPVVSEN